MPIGNVAASAQYSIIAQKLRLAAAKQGQGGRGGEAEQQQQAGNLFQSVAFRRAPVLAGRCPAQTKPPSVDDTGERRGAGGGGRGGRGTEGSQTTRPRPPWRTYTGPPPPPQAGAGGATAAETRAPHAAAVGAMGLSEETCAPASNSNTGTFPEHAPAQRSTAAHARAVAPGMFPHVGRGLHGEGSFDTRGHGYALLLQAPRPKHPGYGAQHRVDQYKRAAEHGGATSQRVRAQRSNMI
jgi:hypothetical protein